MSGDESAFEVQSAGGAGLREVWPGWSGGTGSQEPAVTCCAWVSLGDGLDAGT